ncbi:GNAT family acetyltransferase [Paenibacillus bovis]|uniref:GNAT family acetyltransferase n=2 Tax=Paenibacillus bovis TaxID=1616788 RepID=A0A172ZMB1_9BACL|nr:GNAT family acetyltransferase [Paenibacillus bovis]
MWPDRELDYIKLKDDEMGQHYGLFVSDQLVSVISLFIENNEAQFRKFATLAGQQGQGYGSQLLSYTIQQAKQAGVQRIYCNARTEKTGFYSKFGLLPTGDSFVRGGKSYVIMERVYAASSSTSHHDSSSEA